MGGSGIQPGERVVVWATNVPEWVFLEMVEETMEAIANYARLLKQVYPEYRVRALDAITMKAIVMV